MNDEIWETINGFEHYSVSSLGNVRNDKTGRVLKPRKEGGGYYTVVLCLKGIQKTHKIHRLVGDHFIENPENKRCIDHINHERTDNRAENLRWATTSENNMNASIKSNNTSGYPGVYFDKRRNKWVARISINGKETQLGYFLTIEEAIEARKQAEIQYYGEYANKSI